MDQKLNEENQDDLQQLTDKAIADSKGVEINYDAITYETFNGVKYQDLLAKFKELGVESAWNPGTKAKAMIKDALAKIAVLKELKAKGIEGEAAKDVADKAIDVSKALQDAKEVQTVKQEQQSTEASRDEELKKIKALDLPKETIEKALATTNANLANTPSEAGRAILLRKQSILQEILGIK